ncbi:NAD-dependent epimerase/dehydratase family protein [Streptomyces sp. ODS28]|uniref:NAD-dependent epimerase/dehydratase family protein n=1 Tax=Streptomyces sp. ODS28 TaxID=3136688 RepID=UPI0031EA4249
MTEGSRAVVLGATGQIGRAAVRALAEDGWEVVAASRSGGRDAEWPDGVRVRMVDREQDGALADAVGEGCGMLLDCTAMSPRHARQVTDLAGRVGSAVVLSSGAVYEDERGRSFATQSRPDGFPAYPVPVAETQRTVAPGEADYGARKAALEQELLAIGDKLPVTVLRAAAVHGRHCRTPRELHFVKRWLDGRRVRVLAYGGASRFHPVHVSNVAELVRLAARRPGSRALNAADPGAPTVAEIAEAMDRALGWEAETVTLEGPPPEGRPMLGRTPWSLPHPLVMDMAAAERELGYRAVTTYEDSLPETAEWLAGRLRDRDWRDAFPEMAAAYDPTGDLFDYAAEDAWLAERGGKAE